MARTGRPSKLTPALIAKIAKIVATGAQVDEAALAAGVNRATLQRWLAAGAHATDTLERALVEAVDEAQGKHAARCHGSISAAARKQWKAAQASLQLSNASRYGASRIEFHLSSQLQAAIERLKVEFENEPNTLDRILSCLAGSPGGGGTSGSPTPASGDAASTSSPADSAPPDAAAVGVPRPLV